MTENDIQTDTIFEDKQIDDSRRKQFRQKLY